MHESNFDFQSLPDTKSNACSVFCLYVQIYPDNIREFNALLTSWIKEDEVISIWVHVFHCHLICDFHVIFHNDFNEIRAKCIDEELTRASVCNMMNSWDTRVSEMWDQFAVQLCYLGRVLPTCINVRRIELNEHSLKPTRNSRAHIIYKNINYLSSS